MDSDDQYFHLSPELRQLLLLTSKPPVFSVAVDPISSHPPSPSLLPRPPPGGVCTPQGRWPRQETLTLLEIRAQLDPQFREAGQKGPLWDEVARIMAEQYGYQRTGRKCREKLDNLYKYYKKTKKEGRIGKQLEGSKHKHYRFFRQLEALYETECSAEEEEETETEQVERNYKSWITELMEAQLKRMLEMQEAWFEKMMTSVELMERERFQREESWRREEEARHERERRRLASEREWAEAREAALITALEKIVRQREEISEEIYGM